MQKPIRIDKLTASLLEANPVWEFVNLDEPDETFVRPVTKLPVRDATNRLFGCQVAFADGTPAVALIGNLSLSSSEENQHFRTISLFVGGREFYVSRYHDHDYQTTGPSALAKAVGKKVSDIFPIAYDLSKAAIGALDCVKNSILAEPAKKLSRAEIIRLAVG